MSDKTKTIIAWIMWIVCIVGVGVQLSLWLFHLTGRPSLFDSVEALGWGLVIPITFSSLGLLIITRQPDNRVGWLMMLIALVTGAPDLSDLGYLVVPPATITLGIYLLLWFDGWSWIPVIFPIFLIPLHFPTGRPLSPRWNWVNRLAIGMWLFFISFFSFIPEIGPQNGDWVRPNPIGFIPAEVAQGPIITIWGIGLLAIVATSVYSLFLRYRRAGYGERQQIKWLLYAGVMFGIIYAFYLLFPADELGDFNGLQNLVFVLSILTLPTAITIAILRYRLYDIDIIIRKTLVYGVLSGLLALVYFGSVVLLQTVFEAVSGQQSAVSIVISTLIIAALFTPLRRRVQNFIDRRFFRRKYDAQQVLGRFAQTAKDEVSLEALKDELMRVTQETIQPSTVTIWLKQK